MKRVGIFGGSFDPVHTGHLEAVKSFLNSGLIDEVWILLTPNPPHKKNAVQTDFNHRHRMLELVFEKDSRIKISDLERTLPAPSYTLQTIQYVKSEYPDHLFYLCMGEDSLSSFHTWYKYEEILEECTLMVVNRPGFDLDGVKPAILERTVIVDHIPVRVSSSEIRKRANTNEIQHLPEIVQRYIADHNLYENR